MTAETHVPDSSHPGRHDRLLQEWVHDTYKSKSKLPEPAVCPDCGAIYRHGRWQWGEAEAGAHQETCPACHRVRDKCPAGFLTLGGEFLLTHKDEILHLVHNQEAREKAEHPLKRIIAIETEGDGLTITFTDPHLARGVGEALHHAYQGQLDFRYQEEERILRVNWLR
ncbi:BCAM0308 family protein [Methylococcus sp. EFPC2]|uniref:BCAM0308 family protein n=1 Tax=Methylococcus sp. EFPC2 TaxID=2812648 RepID=UPI0019687338|nr:BCAM0308 family protein [Methylococcus sp. EFPC2]QSA95676.1 ATPase [Methylococcus sp. EFPC2]